MGKSVRDWGFFFIFIVSHSQSRAQELKLVLAQAWPSSFATPLTHTYLIVEQKWPTPQVARGKLGDKVC